MSLKPAAVRRTHQTFWIQLELHESKTELRIFFEVIGFWIQLELHESKTRNDYKHRRRGFWIQLELHESKTARVHRLLRDVVLDTT